MLVEKNVLPKVTSIMTTPARIKLRTAGFEQLLTMTKLLLSLHVAGVIYKRYACEQCLHPIT